MILEKKLKICFFAEADQLEIHSLKWIRYFADRGHDVHLFTYSPKGGELRKNINIHIIRKKFPRAGWPWNTLLNLPLAGLWAKKMIKEINPDIIHSLCFTSYGTLAALSGRHPFVATAFGSDILINPGKNALTKKITVYALRKADLITCDARHMVKAMENLGADAKKIKIINFGIDVKKFSPGPKDDKIRKELGFSEGKTVISLKWLDPLSGIETLIKAVPIVVKKVPDAKFVLVGPGSLTNELKELAKNLGVEKNIIFPGFVLNDKIPDYLRTSDIFVSTSLADAGIAASTAEAMSCALPVVITNIGDNEEWVRDGENGFVVPINDPEKLAERIIDIMKNPELAKKFGEKSRKIIEERNSYYREMEKMENLYYKFAH